VADAFLECGLGCIEIQRGQALESEELRVRETQDGLDAGLVRAGDLFGREVHDRLRKRLECLPLG